MSARYYKMLPFLAFLETISSSGWKEDKENILESPVELAPHDLYIYMIQRIHIYVWQCMLSRQRITRIKSFQDVSFQLSDFIKKTYLEEMADKYKFELVMGAVASMAIMAVLPTIPA